MMHEMRARPYVLAQCGLEGTHRAVHLQSFLQICAFRKFNKTPTRSPLGCLDNVRVHERLQERKDISMQDARAFRREYQ